MPGTPRRIRKQVEMREEREQKRLLKRVVYDRLVAWIFCGILGALTILNVILPDRSFSEAENRNLAQRPAFSGSALADGSFSDSFADYYADQFAGRDLLMQLKFHVEYLSGKRKFADVYEGKDGYLLVEPTEPDEEAVARTADAITKFAAAHEDVDMTAIIVPDAATVLADHLPSGVTVRDQAVDISAFTSMLPERIGITDAVAALRNAEEGQLYYRTDHHWTSLGAYTVFRAAVPVLDVETDGISYKEHLVSETFQGTSSSKSGDLRRKDDIVVYEPLGTDAIYNVNFPDDQIRRRSMFFAEKLEEKDQYTVFFGGNHSVVEIETTVDNDRSILIFKDSYANSFIQFLTPYYHRITLIDPRYYYGDVASALKTYGVTDVLYLYSADTLMTDTALADTLLTGV